MLPLALHCKLDKQHQVSWKLSDGQSVYAAFLLDQHAVDEYSAM